ncbi:MAG: DUF58 domain-containing protein [Gemmataceae bacterium]
MTTNYLDPDVLARIRHLEFSARQIVEGIMSGEHRSPRHGFAVEFAHHREYVPGDDVKHVDWKVFGRTERYYLKQYELETDLTAWFVIDTSASMRYSSHNVSKYDYAALLAASLAHLVIRQSDRIGFVALDNAIRRFLRTSGSGAQVPEMIRLLTEGPGQEPSQIGTALSEVASRLGRRSVVLIFSDFLDEPAELAAGLRRIRFDRHEVIAVQVLDPAEEDFPFSAATLFRGMEIPEELLTDPRGLRRAYLAEVEAHRHALRHTCHELDIHLLEVRTDADPGLTLARYLATKR